MGGYYGLVVLVGVAVLLPAVHCDVSCKGVDGHAGLPGPPGRDGWPGVKGEKGEPAVKIDGPMDPSIQLSLKGEMGNRGLQGPMGPKGFAGDLGAAGHPGLPGSRGPDGRSQGQHGSQQNTISAFSVIRTDTGYPPYGQKITFQKTVVNRGGDIIIRTGIFTCRVAGVYYFNFHSIAKTSICLNLVVEDAVSQEQKLRGFCDYNTKLRQNHDQVLSGGMVLQLVTGQKVWLESFRDQQTDADRQDNREKQIIFNGFLLFASPA